ncbi:hypothetical protein Rsub_03307 [Raphidocelis subcapitata]|uniref:Sugar phosphate phosphatase n=1 Tax=Raphidocelis subcapitata TaxID=307507 RepID=A0A2V0NRA6_9CHLO|nr:hypothetical protein Rsub_03307 [Raphidocelis subcapitata]|eukprot:GBF90174.1 hypothetical protein Rsub_03307 [Raphidocelis subcapitata]
MSAPSPAAAAAAAAPRGAAVPADAAALSALPFPPHPPLAGSERGSFAEGTIKKRLPAILDTVLADLAAFAAASPAAAEAAAAASEAVRAMQAEMPADGRVTPLAAPRGAPAHLREVVEWTNAGVAAWQRRGEKLGFSGGWLGLPWLVVECYLYARLATIVAAQPTLAAADYDPFAKSKLQALFKSGAAVGELAAAGEGLLKAEAAAAGDAGAAGKLLREVFMYALWGNKTDLSMLVDASKLDVNASVRGAAAGAGAAGNLLVDEADAAWAALQAAPAGGRIDIVLDNAGLELYTDLLLADCLIQSGLADTVVLHGKLLPWFVSDTTHRDLGAVISALGAAAPPEGMAVPAGQWDSARRLAARWGGHLKAGRWQYKDHVFWTTPFPFWWMEQAAPDLYSDLASSKLVIFKGDLNYRQLAYDCRWPLETPFPSALGPFRPAPLVTLRTLKADVMAGLAPGQGAALDAVDPDWQVNGRFGVVQFAPGGKKA